MNYKYDIIKNKNKFFLASLIIIVVIFLFAIFKGVDLDIQFKGGTIITYSYNGDLDTNKVKESLSNIVKETMSVQQVEDIANSKKQIQVSVSSSGLDTEVLNNISSKLVQDFNANSLEEVQISNVSPSIGNDFFRKSLVAVVFASIMMIIYIAIRFKNIGGFSAGLMAVVALIHDIIIVFGTFVILGFPIDNNFIAVVLTILGYSVNDTIVIYDRVRENKRILSKGTKIGDIMNISINQSLNRSINTTISTVIALVVICLISILFNVTSIITFALPMIIGMVSGVYSTIFIAGPLWVTYKNMKDKKSKKN